MVLDARCAVQLLVIYLVAQIAVAVCAGFGLAAVLSLRGDDSSAGVAPAELRKVEGPAGVVGLAVAGGLVAALELRRRRSPASRRAFGWAPARRRRLLLAAIAGMGISLGYVGLANALWPVPADFTPGPTARMALSDGWQQQVWRVAVLAVSPPVEEFLFRGVLLAGFAHSWGTPLAGLVTTALFVGMHYPEFAAYLPAVFGLTALSVVALLLRIRSGSLAPAVAVHFGYNLCLVALSFLAELAEGGG